ncbi:SRPBCC family protein [Jannaschia sp. CCS1]|uniref:SRPBCC family protein n=1 Tax=Jannaschia sp. (strain CCS1) TaxID=290400 RepID=UPI000053CAF3|nr:SRPBCC domain-containing protein [Jannaschia sp. CCS1]ABD53478.1 hypothetical protein Jann_0561 [Jannaschia sp. CCS1]
MTTDHDITGDTLTLRRTYASAKEDVFNAWIDASKTTHWWGCKDTSKVVSTIDARVGGTYHHLMSIDGVGDHLIDGTIQTFDPPNRLTYTMSGMPGQSPMRVDVRFKEVDGGTEVTLTHAPLPEAFNQMVLAGWTASFERLARFFDGELRVA